MFVSHENGFDGNACFLACKGRQQPETFRRVVDSCGTEQVVGCYGSAFRRGNSFAMQ